MLCRAFVCLILACSAARLDAVVREVPFVHVVIAKSFSNFPGQITLANDSPFILTASVFTHSGEYLGQVILQPGQQKNFVTSLSATSLSRPGYPEVSITPYRVIWQCPGGSFYSMCVDGSVGSYVRANACEGVRHCTPKDRKKPKEPGALPPAKAGASKK